MNKFRSFQEFLSNSNIPVETVPFVVNLVLAALLSYILSRMYVRLGRSLSNRAQFAENFVLLTMTTMVIITIVKSSLALSLGLVGALSIVRFRAAIKEPEELSYLFLSIAIGLGLGANQQLITLLAFAIITAVLILKNRTLPKRVTHNYNLTVSSPKDSTVTLDQIVEILSKTSSRLNLRRFDESREALEASFLVEFANFSELSETRNSLNKLNNQLQITFLDNKGIM